MQTIRIDTLSPEQLAELDTFYRTTRQARLRTRAQIILLSGEEHLAPQQIAPVVRMSEQTVRRWLKRYQSHQWALRCPALGSAGYRHAGYRHAGYRHAGYRHAAWTCLFRFGRVSAWPTSWPKRPAFGSILIRCVVI